MKPIFCAFILGSFLILCSTSQLELGDQFAAFFEFLHYSSGTGFKCVNDAQGKRMMKTRAKPVHKPFPTRETKHRAWQRCGKRSVLALVAGRRNRRSEALACLGSGKCPQISGNFVPVSPVFAPINLSRDFQTVAPLWEMRNTQNRTRA